MNSNAAETSKSIARRFLEYKDYVHPSETFVKQKNNEDTNKAQEKPQGHIHTPPPAGFSKFPATRKRKLTDQLNDNLEHIDGIESHQPKKSSKVKEDKHSDYSDAIRDLLNDSWDTSDLIPENPINVSKKSSIVKEDENSDYSDAIQDLLNDSWDTSDLIPKNSIDMSISQSPSTTGYRNLTQNRVSSSQPLMSTGRNATQTPISSSQPDVRLYQRTSPSQEFASQEVRMQDQMRISNIPNINYDQLTTEQKQVAEDVLSGRNVFITGPAGTGKSFIFKYLVKKLSDLHGENAVAVTAPTGVAAVNVDGVTIHSHAGIGLGQGSEDELFLMVLAKPWACVNWRRTKVLMIDEISMLGSELFSKLANIGGRLKKERLKKEKAKTARAADFEDTPILPFGGIQVILCGDFFQLPPVNLGSKNVGSFAFNSPSWNELNVKTFKLTSIQRQNDKEFIDLLKTVRLGDVDEKINLLEICRDKLPPEDGIEPTKLMCTNNDVDAENNQELKKLEGPETSFRAIDNILLSFKPDSKKRLKEGVEKKVTENLILKPGAQVVLIKNIDVERKLVNGTRGVVVGFKWEHGFMWDHSKPNTEAGKKISSTRWCPVIKWDCGITEGLIPHQFLYRSSCQGLICREQFPLKLAWCLTVHKSQGMTLSRAEIRIYNAFEFGQVYVALSRCVSLDGLWIRGAAISQRAVKAHPEVKKFYNQ